MTKSKFTSTVIGASVVILLINIFSRGVGMIREIVFANAFGLNKSFELYLIGAGIPLVISSSLLYFSSHFFIPVYNNLKAEKSSSEANLFFNKTLTLFFITSAIASVLLFFTASNVISFFVSAENSDDFIIAVRVFRIYLVTIPFYALISIISAYMQAEFEFTKTYLSQLWPNFIIIPTVLLFSGKESVIAIPIGYGLGISVQLLQLLFNVRKTIRPSFSIELSYFKIAGIPLLFTLAIEVIGQTHIIIDRLFYSKCDNGGIAALNYAMIVYNLFIAIISMAFSAAIFPKLTKDYAEGNKESFERSFRLGLGVNTLLFSFIMIILVLTGNLLVTILFKRGAFTSADVIHTNSVLLYYALALPFISGTTIVYKVLYSMKMSKILFVLSIVGIVIKVVTNLILVNSIHESALALGTGLCFVFMFMSGVITICIKAKFSISKELKVFLFYIVLALSVAIITYLTTYALPISDFLMKVIIISLLILLYPIFVFVIKTDVSIELENILLSKVPRLFGKIVRG